MSETTVGNSRMLRDTFLYMCAKMFEGIVGIVTISVLTYLFVKEDFGRYTLWNITATTFAMLSIQWLSQSASRYLNEYELNKEHAAFYSTVFWAWLRVNACAVIVSAALAALLAMIGERRAPGFISFVYGDWMFVLAVVYFVTYNTSQLLIALLSVKRKAGTNLVISVSSSAGKLLLIYVFSKVFGANIGIIFLSYIICDLFVILIALIRLASIKYIDTKKRSKALLGEFGRYGAPLVGNLATTTVLNNSDRFIIEQYLGRAQVGIYTTNYSVVSSVFTMLQTAIMRGSYPTILKTYAEGNKELTEKLVSQAVRNYLIVAVPSVVGVGVLAKPLAELLFEKSYVEGYAVMVWVALGMLFLGLTEYSNKPWELSAKTWYIFKNSLIGGATNIALNIIFMRRFGYMTAAYSTLAGFFIYFCLSKYGSVKYMKWRIGIKTYASIIGGALLMGLCLFFAIEQLGVTKLTLFAYVVAGVLIYGAFLLITGVVKEEAQMLRNILKRRAGA